MSRVISAIFSTTGVVSTLLCAVLWLAIRPSSAAARRFLFAVAVCYTVASVSCWEGDDIVHGWEGQRFSVLNGASASRVLETFRVYRLLARSLIICSGGLPDPNAGANPSRATMRDALVTLGVPASTILIEDTSGNTHDEAQLVGRLLRSRHFAKGSVNNNLYKW